MHIADVPGRHAPGTGEINYSKIFRVLGELGYSRYIAMEFMPLGEPIQELRAAREMAVSSARAAHAARSLASGRQHESA
jgi:hydroxypyruvate isomerase